jgi:hypothetical protein
MPKTPTGTLFTALVLTISITATPVSSAQVAESLHPFGLDPSKFSVAGAWSELTAAAAGTLDRGTAVLDPIIEALGRLGVGDGKITSVGASRTPSGHASATVYGVDVTFKLEISVSTTYFEGQHPVTKESCVRARPITLTAGVGKLEVDCAGERPPGTIITVCATAVLYKQETQIDARVVCV